MSVGGRVIEVRCEGPKSRIWVVDTYPGHDETTIYVETEAEMPACGDTVWWHGRAALWTPADRRFVDRKLTRIGYSVRAPSGDA